MSDIDFDMQCDANRLELEACPFCGNQNEMDMSWYRPPYGADGEPQGDDGEYVRYYPVCPACHATGAEADTAVEAVELWNKVSRAVWPS